MADRIKSLKVWWSMSAMLHQIFNDFINCDFQQKLNLFIVNSVDPEQVDLDLHYLLILSLPLLFFKDFLKFPTSTIPPPSTNPLSQDL